MTDLRASAQQALEAWNAGDAEWFKRAYTVMDALKAALAEPVQDHFPDVTKMVQEPVGVRQFRTINSVVWYDGYADHEDGGGPYEERTLYASPPQRKPLTEEELFSLIRPLCVNDQSCRALLDLSIDEYRAIEQAHGIGSKT